MVQGIRCIGQRSTSVNTGIDFSHNAYSGLKLGVRFNVHGAGCVCNKETAQFLPYAIRIIYVKLICNNALTEKEQMDSGVLLSQNRLALLGEICLNASSHEDNFEVFPTEGNKR